MRGLSLSNDLFCESPSRRPSFSSPPQRGVGREFQILQANCNQNIASIIMKNHFSEASFAGEKSKGHRKVSPFRQPRPSPINSPSPVVILQLLPCIPLLQTCRTFSNPHLSGIRLRTNANKRTSKVSCIVLLPRTCGTELKMLYLQPWTFLSSDVC